MSDNKEENPETGAGGGGTTPATDPVRWRVGLRGRYLPVKSTDLLYTWILESMGPCEKHIDHKCFSKIKFGLRHDENLAEFYVMTKFEF